MRKLLINDMKKKKNCFHLILASLSRSMLNKSIDEIELPPEPHTKCNKRLQVNNLKLTS